MAILHAHGCDTVQGYLFSQPLSSDLVEQLLRTHHAKPRESLPLAS